jgi:hypothetical protein
MFEKPKRPLKGFNKTQYTINRNLSPLLLFYKLIHKNLGLDPDTIRIQQQPGSESECSTIPTSGSGLGEWYTHKTSGFKTSDLQNVRFQNV